MTFPGMDPPKTVLAGVSQPKVVHKDTGEIYVIVRDDVAANGKLYIAPQGRLTEMHSIRPEVFKEEFEWFKPASAEQQAAREVNFGERTSLSLKPEDVEAELWPEKPEEAPAPEEPKKKGGRPRGSKDTKPRKKRGKPKSAA